MVTGEGELYQVNGKQKRKKQQGTWKIREYQERNKRRAGFPQGEIRAAFFLFCVEDC